MKNFSEYRLVLNNLYNTKLNELDKLAHTQKLKTDFAANVVSNKNGPANAGLD